MPKQLIVNADDFGITPEVTRGILEVARAGVVRSTTAMTNGPHFGASMAALAASGLDLDVGLHCTLTWGRPLTDPREVPTLVGPDGRFLSRIALLRRAILGGIAVDEAYRELRAQAERLLAVRPSITHLDGHHHVHTFPTIALAAERVAERFGIRYVRAPLEGRWSPATWATVRRLVVAALPAAGPGYWRRRKLLTSDHFGGFALGARPGLRERWIAALGRVRPGITEIMVHPGYVSTEIDGYNAGREEEVRVLTDAAILAAAREAGVEIIGVRKVTAE